MKNFNSLKIHDSLIQENQIEKVTMEKDNNSTIEDVIKNNSYSELKGKVQILLTTDEKNIYNNYNIVDYEGNNIVIPDFSNDSLDNLNVYKKAFLLFTPQEDINNLEIYSNNSHESLKNSNIFKKDSNYLLIIPTDLTTDTIYLSSDNNTKLLSLNISAVSSMNTSSLSEDKFQYNATTNKLEGSYKEVFDEDGVNPDSYGSIKYLLNDEVVNPDNINYSYDQNNGTTSLEINLDDYTDNAYSGRIINIDKLGFINSLSFSFDKNVVDNNNSDTEAELKFLCNNEEVKDNEVINSTPSFSIYYKNPDNSDKSNIVKIAKLKYSASPITNSNYSLINDLSLYSKGENKYEIIDSNDNLYEFQPGYYSITIESGNNSNIQCSKTYNFLLDSVKPEIKLKEVKNTTTNEILSPINDNTYYINNNVTVSFDLSSNIVPCKEINVVLEGSDGSKQNLECINETLNLDSSKMNGGIDYKLRATAISNGNNTSDELTLFFKYNSSSPNISIMDYNNQPINNTNNKFSKEFLPKILLEYNKFDYANLHILKSDDTLINNSIKVTNFTVKNLDSEGNYISTSKNYISLKMLPGEGLTFDCDNLTTGIYDFIINLKDNYGNEAIIPVNFSIATNYNDISAKLAYNSASNTIPCFNNIYYINNSFIANVTLPPQLEGYKLLNGSLYTSNGTSLINTNINDNLINNKILSFNTENGDWTTINNGNLKLDITATTNFNQKITKSFNIVNDTTPPQANIYLTGKNNTFINDIATNINYCPNISLDIIDDNIIPKNKNISAVNIINFQYCEDFDSNNYKEINDYRFIQSSENEENFYLVNTSNDKVMLKNGKYKVELKLFDKALNSTTYNFEFIVDSNKPELNINNTNFYNIDNNSDFPNPIVFNDSVILSQDFALDLSLNKNASGYSDVSGILGCIDNEGNFKKLQTGTVNIISNNKFTLKFTDLKKLINKDNDNLILKLSATTGSNLTSESFINIKYDTTAPELKLLANDVEITDDKLYTSTPNIYIKLSDFTIGKDYFNNKLNSLTINKFTYSTNNTSKDLDNLSIEPLNEDYSKFVIKENNKDFIFNAGNYKITLCATDSLGHKTTKDYSFFVDNINPEITYTKISSKNNTLYESTDYPDDSTIYINDDFTIDYTFNDNTIGYSNLSISLLDNNNSIYETSNCIDDNCSLDSNVHHKYTIKIPDEYKNSSSKNFKVKTVLTSKGNGTDGKSLTKYFTVNYDDIQPTITINNDKEIKDNDLFNNFINPIVRVSDFNSNKSIIDIKNNNEELTPNSIRINSAKLTYVNNDTTSTKTLNLHLRKTDNHNEFKFIDNNNNDYTFTDGQYSLSLSYKDINGNETTKKITFNIEVNPKAINSTLDLPKYNNTYYANNENFNVEINLPLQLMGYKKLKVEFLDTNLNIIDTFNYNSELDSKGKYIIPVNCRNIPLYNSTSKDFIIKVTAITSFNNSVEEFFNNIIYDTTAPTSSLNLVDDNNSTVINSLDNNKKISSVNYEPNIVFEIKDPNLIEKNEIISSPSAELVDFSFSNSKDGKYNSILDKVKLLQTDYADHSDFKITSLSGTEYKLNNGFYKITLQTIDKSRNTTTYDYEFIVDTTPVEFTTTFNINNSPINYYNDTYYINTTKFTATTTFKDTLSGYKDLSLSLSTLDDSEKIFGTCNESTCTLDPNKAHDFEFDLSKLSNLKTEKLILTATLTNNAGSVKSLNYNFIYDNNKPNGSLEDNNSKIEGVLNYIPNNPILKINDENIDNNMAIVNKESEMKPNSIFIKKFNKETLNDNGVDLTNYISLSLDTYNSNNDTTDLIFKFLNKDNSLYMFDDGIYNIDIIVCDLNGNTSTLNFNFTIGSLPPSGTTTLSYKAINNTEVTLSNPTNKVYVPIDCTLLINIDSHISGFKDSSISVQYTDTNDNTSNYPLSKLLVNSNNNNGISNDGVISGDKNSKNCTLKFTEEGSYLITTTVKTNSNQPEYVSNITIIVDKTAPTVDLISNNTTGSKDNMLFTNSPNPSVSYIAKDKNFKSINKLSVNGVEVPQNDLNTISQFTNDGIYNIEIVAEDYVGRTSTKTIHLTVDKELPTITLPTILSFNNVGGVNFTNRVAPYDYSVTDAYLESENCTVNGMVYLKGNSISGDGDKLIEITAKDYAGNVKKETFSYKLDTVSPELSIEDVIAEKYYNIDVLPKYKATDLYLDNSSISATINGNPFNNAAISADGNYSFRLSAKDYAGNYSEKSLSFVIDKIAPIITFDGIKEDEINPGVVTPRILIDDPTATATYFLNGEEYYGEPIVDNKKFTLLVTCVDKAGNFSKKAISFIVDSFGPEIALELQGIGDIDKRIYKPGVKPIITVTKNASYTMLLDSKKYNGEEINDEGSHTIEITAKDSAGNITNFKESFIIVKDLSVASSPTVKSQKNNTLIVTASISTIVVLFAVGTVLFVRKKKRTRENN